MVTTATLPAPTGVAQTTPIGSPIERIAMFAAIADLTIEQSVKRGAPSADSSFTTDRYDASLSFEDALRDAEIAYELEGRKELAARCREIRHDVNGRLVFASEIGPFVAELVRLAG
jgi:hypothetical protein